MASDESGSSQNVSFNPLETDISIRFKDLPETQFVDDSLEAESAENGDHIEGVQSSVTVICDDGTHVDRGVRSVDHANKMASGRQTNSEMDQYLLAGQGQQETGMDDHDLQQSPTSSDQSGMDDSLADGSLEKTGTMEDGSILPPIGSNSSPTMLFSSPINAVPTTTIVTSKPKNRGATYDGNVCIICGDRASGVHYGRLACEGCKGFFKRVSKEPEDIAAKRRCVYGGNCDINFKTRNRCQYCRLQKCLRYGMSKKEIKLGRRSKRLKDDIALMAQLTSKDKTQDRQTTQAVQGLLSLNTNTSTTTAGGMAASPQLSASNVIMLQGNLQPGKPNIISFGGKQVIAMIQDNKMILKPLELGIQEVLAQLKNDPSQGGMNASILTLPKVDSLGQSGGSTTFLINSNDLASATGAGSEATYALNLDNAGNLSLSNAEPELEFELEQFVAATYQAHVDTWAYTKEKMNQLPVWETVPQELAHMFESIAVNDVSLSLTELLVKTSFLEKFNNLIEQVVLFAKNVPKFMELNDADRIQILKAGVFEVICVRYAHLIDCERDRALVPEWDCYLPKMILKSIGECDQLVEKLFQFAAEFNSYELSDQEISLFAACILIAPVGRSNIKEEERVHQLHQMYKRVLRQELERHRGVAFAMSIQQKTDDVMNQLRTLNEMHASILTRLKGKINFPDLYAELYNLND